MPRGKHGADCNDLVTARVNGVTLMDLAKGLFGTEAAFFGRYFKNPHHPDEVQYQPTVENPALHARDIRVLPIARQTTHVGGSEAEGREDARRNADAVLWAFGEEWLAQNGGEFQYYLDVEPTHPLSTAYYKGWAEEIIARSRAESANNVTLHPCVYVNFSDHTTHRNLTRAMQDLGVPCDGLWVARYFNHDHTGCHLPVDWNPARAIPPDAAPAPVRIWQYVGDCFGATAGNGPIDGNQLNPDLETETLNALIPAPES